MVCHLFYAVATSFREISYTFLGYTAGLVLLTDVLEFFRIKQRQRDFRVTTAGVFGALLGAVVLEVAFGRDTTYRIETADYTYIGSLGMTLIRLGVGVSLLILWLARVRAGSSRDRKSGCF